MKATLRYLLMVVAMVSVLGVSAQSTAQLPEAKMQSTSVMVGSGSSLPQAAVTGVETTESQTVGKHIRKGSINPGGGPGDRPEPWEDPLGDVFWPLMLLAGVYALMRVILNRKRAGERR